MFTGKKREQTRSIIATPAIRAASRNAPRRTILDGKYPRARGGKGRRAHDAEGGPLARQPVREAQASTPARSIRTRRRSPKTLDVGRSTARTRGSTDHGRNRATLEGLAALKAGRRIDRRRLTSRSSTSSGRAYATGKRKNAVARVWVKPGNGKITVNAKDARRVFRAPRAAHDAASSRSQSPNRAGPVRRHRARCRAAASRARPARCATASPRRSPITSRSCGRRLKKAGFLTRDSRVVERKKYGRKKARRSFQFSKR